ncbi:MAG: cytidylate kinase family protein, partial [Isosphaeraceae bacterium]
MYQKTATEHFAEAMARLSKHPHPFAHAKDQPQAKRPEAPTGTAFAIAFSREAGAGGITVAREVGRRLSWPVYDQELLESLAKELNVDISFLEDYDERRGSFLVDTIKAFSAAASVSEVTYFRRL